MVRILCEGEGSSCRENVFVVRIDGCELSFVWVVDGGELSRPKAHLKFRCELTSALLVGPEVTSNNAALALTLPAITHDAIHFSALSSPCVCSGVAHYLYLRKR